MNDFEIIAQMISENKDIAVFPDLVRVQQVKLGYQVTIGVPEDVGAQIARQAATNDITHAVMLIRVNLKQFNAIKKKKKK